MFSNYHTHTFFCDGADSPEELVLEAIRLGCPEIGFSGHSCLSGENWCMTETGMQQYCAEIRYLQKKYVGRIKIRLGVELDIRSEIDPTCFDYIIGAVHYVPKDGVFYPVDESRETFIRAVYEAWDGDYYSFAEDYYMQIALSTGCCKRPAFWKSIQAQLPGDIGQKLIRKQELGIAGLMPAKN